MQAAPDSAEVAYNLGVAAYRGGRFEESAQAFEVSASLADADLAASAMYNEGTARYAEAIQRLNQEEQNGAAPSPIQTAQEGEQARGSTPTVD